MNYRNFFKVVVKINKTIYTNLLVFLKLILKTCFLF